MACLTLLATGTAWHAQALGTGQGGVSAGMSAQQALEVRRPGNVAISPDGKMVAFVVTRAHLATDMYAGVLYVVPSGGGRPRALAEAPALTAVQWSPDGAALFYLAKTKGTYQAWRVRAQGTAAQQLTHHRSGIAAGLDDEYVNYLKPFRVAPNGRRALFFARDTINAQRQYEARQGGSFRYTSDMSVGGVDRGRGAWLTQPAASAELWLVDLGTGVERRVWVAPKTASRWPIPINFDWSPNGRHVAMLYEYDDAWILRGRLAILSGDTFEVRDVLPQLGWSVDPVWAPDSRAVLFTSEGEITTRTQTRHHYQKYQYSLDDGRLTLADSAGDPTTDVVKAVKRRTGEYVYQCALDRRRLRAACVREAAMLAPEVVAYKLESGGVAPEQTVLTQLNPELALGQLGEAKPLSWRRENGDTGTSGVILPVGYTPARRYPLVVMQYNVWFAGHFTSGAGPFTSYAPQAFAAHGYVVLLQNLPYNTHDYPPGDFARARAQEADAVSLSLRVMLDTLIARGIVDSTRMGIMGWSWGGFFAPYVLTHYPAWFRAGAMGEGGNHQPSAYWQGGAVGRAQEDAYFGGGPSGKFAERWRAVAPIDNVERLRAPLLMEYSGAYLLGVELQRAILDNGGQAELVIYPTEEHTFQRPANRYASMIRHYDWFNFWLLGEEDPAPEKRDQYERWRAMRAAPAMGDAVR